MPFFLKTLSEIIFMIFRNVIQVSSQMPLKMFSSKHKVRYSWFSDKNWYNFISIYTCYFFKNHYAPVSQANWCNTADNLFPSHSCIGSYLPFYYLASLAQSEEYLLQAEKSWVQILAKYCGRPSQYNNVGCLARLKTSFKLNHVTETKQGTFFFRFYLPLHDAASPVSVLS